MSGIVANNRVTDPEGKSWIEFECWERVNGDLKRFQRVYPDRQVFVRPEDPKRVLVGPLAEEEIPYEEWVTLSWRAIDAIGVKRHPGQR